VSELGVYGGHHGRSAVTLVQQQATQPAQVRDRVGGRVVDQIGNLAQPEAQPPVAEHLPQSFHVARGVGPVSGHGARRWPYEADLVVVMQGADGYAGQLGHPSHGQLVLHAYDYVASRHVRDKCCTVPGSARSVHDLR
jgi:hypothetical protein